MFKIVSINGIEIPSLIKIGLTKNDFAGILLTELNNDEPDNIHKVGFLDNKITHQKAPIKTKDNELEKLKKKFKSQTSINDVVKVINWVWDQSIRQGYKKNSIRVVINECLESVKISFEKIETKKKSKFLYIDNQGSERQFFRNHVNGSVNFETKRQYYNEEPFDLGRSVITKPVFTILNGRYDVQFRALD